MIQAIRDVYAWINNTIFMRRIKGVKVFNPTQALGFNDYDVNIDSIIELWGEDPVHPTPAAYQVLANKLVAMVDDMMAESTGPAPVPSNDNKKRAAHREPWIVSSEPVAKRLIPAGNEKPRRGNNNNRFNSGRGIGNRGGNRGRGDVRHVTRGSVSGVQYGRGSARGGNGGFRGHVKPPRGGRWQRGRGWF
jgi:hypothetical protein